MSPVPSFRAVHVGDPALARNGRRAGSVGLCVARLLASERVPHDRLVVRFLDDERVAYHPDDLDLAPALRAKPLSAAGGAP